MKLLAPQNTSTEVGVFSFNFAFGLKLAINGDANQPKIHSVLFQAIEQNLVSNTQKGTINETND